MLPIKMFIIFLFFKLKLLLYLFKHYKLKIKCLNLLNNQIDNNLKHEINKYVKNDYDFDANSKDTLDYNDAKKNSSKIKAIEKNLLKTSNKIHSKNSDSNEELLRENELDLKLRDQLKLEEYINNANKFNDLKEDVTQHRNEKMEYQRELDRLEYQRALERDYNSTKSRYDRWRENDKFINEKLNVSNILNRSHSISAVVLLFTK